ncbi:hypothetical protein ACU81Q_14725 [Komagataeibacter melomenusus]
MRPFLWVLTAILVGHFLMGISMTVFNVVALVLAGLLCWTLCVVMGAIFLAILAGAAFVFGRD